MDSRKASNDRFIQRRASSDQDKTTPVDYLSYDDSELLLIFFERKLVTVSNFCEFAKA